MTVTTSTARVVHNGNGTTTQFAVPFRFLENAQVAVFLRDAAGGQIQWTENTQYTLTGADAAAGGTLTVITSPTDHTPATGEKLVVVRAVPITQETDYVENDPFPAETHERALDKLTMVNQEQTERLDRTFTIPETDTLAANFVLPIDTDRASQFLAFDSLGNPIVAAGTSANLGPVSPYIDTLLSAVDAAAARVTLDAQVDVINTRGDLVVGSATPAAARLGIGAAGAVLTSDGTDPAWVVVAESALSMAKAPPEISNNAGDATNSIDIAVGKCRDDADTANLVVATAIGKDISATWATGGTTATPTGGMSSTLHPVQNDTWYHVILGLVAGVPEVGFDTSITGANLVTDHSFTNTRRIGSVRRGTATNRLFFQDGDQFLWDVAFRDDNTANPGTAARSITLLTPLGVKVTATVYAFLQSNAGPQTQLLITSLDVADTAPSLTNPHQVTTESSPNSGNFPQTSEVLVRTNTSSQIRSRVSASSSVVFTRLHTAGWIDRRGRDA